nr:MAG TPA: hypothetical protein [Caudoviricetes sp.]
MIKNVKFCPKNAKNATKKAHFAHKTRYTLH